MLTIRLQFHEEKHVFYGSFQNFDNATVKLELSTLMTAKTNDVEVPTITDFVLTQSKDAFCNETKQLVRTPYFFTLYKKRTLREPSLSRRVYTEVRTEQFMPYYSTLDTFFYLSSCPGELQMYDSVRGGYCWPELAADVYSTVKSYIDCPVLRTKLRH